MEEPNKNSIYNSDSLTGNPEPVEEAVQTTDEVQTPTPTATPATQDTIPQAPTQATQPVNDKSPIKNIITILLLIFVTPIGIIVMWIIASWSKTIKAIITLLGCIVIPVILGILSTFILAAINPAEQINKAKEMSVRYDAAELLNALEKYHTTNNAYPWVIDSTYTVPGNPGTPGLLASNAEWMVEGENSLLSGGEITDEFMGRDSLNKIYIYWDTKYDLVRICYEPVNSYETLETGWNEYGMSDPTGTYSCVPE